MAVVMQMTNEIRQMLYNFGYKTKFVENADGTFTATLHKVEGAREVSGTPDNTRLEALLQAYLSLLRVLRGLKANARAVVNDVEGPKDAQSPTPMVTDQMHALLTAEGYKIVLDHDASGYGWRAAVYVKGSLAVYTDYAATKFDALTHAMGFLIEYLERQHQPGMEGLADTSPGRLVSSGPHAGR